MLVQIVAPLAKIPASNKVPESTPSVSARFVPSGSSRSVASSFAASADITCLARTIIEAAFSRRWKIKFTRKL
jgi:hypothetical protein